MAKRVISGPLFKQSWVALDEDIHSFEESIMQHERRNSIRLDSVIYLGRVFVVESVSCTYWNSRNPVCKIMYRWEKRSTLPQSVTLPFVFP